MGYIFGLIVTALFFAAMHYFTELDKKQKITISAVLFAIITSATAFNIYSAKEQEKMLNVVMRFEQHKDVECNGITVNDANFSLSVGTYTFIGKKGTPNYDQMISVSECE